jgi:hypothetical protein
MEYMELPNIATPTEITGSGACSASGMEARQGEKPGISRDFSEADSPVPGGETPV